MFEDEEHLNPNYFQQVLKYVRPELEIAFHAAQFASNREPTPAADRYFALQQLQGVFLKYKWEFSSLRHYYRNHALLSAQQWSNQLAEEAEPIQVPNVRDAIPLGQSYFESVIYDVVLGGYVAMYHKLEALVEYLKSHSKGAAFGAMIDSPTPVDYEPVLEAVGIRFKDMSQAGGDARNFDQRIHRIREIANRSKHQGGYLKSASDILNTYIPEQDLRLRIEVQQETFLFDFWYVEVYMTVISALVTQACHTVALVEEIKAEELGGVPVPKGMSYDSYLRQLRDASERMNQDFAKAAENFKSSAFCRRHPVPPFPPQQD